MKIQKTIEVSEASSKMGEAVKSLCINTKKALADGFQAGQDIPTILVSSMQDLLAAVAVVNAIGEEAKEPVLMAKSILVPVLDGVEELLKK